MKNLDTIIKLILLYLWSTTIIAQPYSAAPDPSWTWQDRTKHQVFFRGPDGRQISSQVYLPYETADNRINSQIPDRAIEDGWMLAHRNFGSDGNAPYFPFFTLYNKYRGLFRVMIYNGINRDDSMYIGKLYFLDWEKGDYAPSVFTIQNPNKYALTDFDKSQAEVCLAPMKTYGDWGVFDFTLAGYDPSLKAKNPVLVFTLTGIVSSSIHLDGKSDIQLVQDTVKERAIPSFSLNERDLKVAAEHGSYYYKSTRAFIDSIRSEKNKDQWYYPTAMKLSQTALASFAPWAGALVGVVETFIGGTHKASEWEPLRFSGQMAITIEGAIDTRRQLWAANFYMNEGPPNALAERPVQPIPWGIFNITEPIKWKMERLDPPRGVNVAKKIRWTIGSGGEVVVNPDLGMHLQSIQYAFEMRKSPPLKGPMDFSTMFRSVPAAPSPFMDLGRISSEGWITEEGPYWQGERGFHPTGVVLHLQFKTDAPTRFADDEITIVKKVAFPQHGRP